MCLGNYKLPFYLKRGRNIFDMTVGHTSQLCGKNTNFSNFSKIKLSQTLWLMTPSWRNISSNHLSKSNNFLCCPALFTRLSLLACLSQHPLLAEFLLLKLFQGSNKQIVKFWWRKTVFAQVVDGLNLVFSELDDASEYQDYPNKNK